MRVLSAGVVSLSIASLILVTTGCSTPSPGTASAARATNGTTRPDINAAEDTVLD